MKTITHNNIEIPSIGLGTYKLYGNECTKITLFALDLGYRVLDTAQYYENEFAVGDALKQTNVAREDIYLTTKISPPNMNIGHPVESVENSLRRLQTDYVDLVLLHAPPNKPAEEILDQLRPLIDQGKVKAFGISNFYGDQLDMVIKNTNVPLANHQFEWQPFIDVEPMTKKSWDAGMFVTAYCPIARGAVLDDPTITEIAKRYGKTNAQITLRWLIQHGKTLVIPKTSSEDRLKENFDLFDFELSDDDMAAITNIPKDEERRVIKGAWLDGKRG